MESGTLTSYVSCWRSVSVETYAREPTERQDANRSKVPKDSWTMYVPGQDPRPFHRKILCPFRDGVRGYPKVISLSELSIIVVPVIVRPVLPVPHSFSPQSLSVPTRCFLPPSLSQWHRSLYRVERRSVFPWLVYVDASRLTSGLGFRVGNSVVPSDGWTLDSVCPWVSTRSTPTSSRKSVTTKGVVPLHFLVNDRRYYTGAFELYNCSRRFCLNFANL